jgi:ribosome assembly protein YihI (activator of Der GTPase)
MINKLLFLALGSVLGAVAVLVAQARREQANEILDRIKAKLEDLGIETGDPE